MWLLRWFAPCSFAPTWCRKSRNSGLPRALRGIPAERHSSTDMTCVMVWRGHVLELFSDLSSSRPRSSSPSSFSCCHCCCYCCCTTYVTSISKTESELSKLLLSALAPTSIASTSILDIGVDRLAKGSRSAARRALTCRRVVECWVLVYVCVGRLVYSHISLFFLMLA